MTAKHDSQTSKIIGTLPLNGKYVDHSKRYATDYDRVCIIICTHGKADIDIESRDFTIREKYFIVIGPGKNFGFTDSAKDFKADIYWLGIDILPIDELKHVYSIKRIYDDEPVRKIPDEKYIMCRFIGNYLKDFQNEYENTYQVQILRNYLNILFYEACNIFINEKKETPDSKNRYLTKRFLAEVESNFRNERKVAFYAERLGITPKYLSTLVGKETGHSATEWIDEYTLLEAKKLLRDRKMTIYQIAYELSFSTPSHFGSFFQKHTGMTPKEFIKSQHVISHNEGFPLE